MVRLDEKLLFDARHSIDASNVHRLNEMVLAYQQAVELHNAQSKGHEQYDQVHELQLRSYVVTHRLRKLTEQSATVLKRANSLIKRSMELHAKSDQIEAKADDTRQKD